MLLLLGGDIEESHGLRPEKISWDDDDIICLLPHQLVGCGCSERKAKKREEGKAAWLLFLKDGADHLTLKVEEKRKGEE